MAITTVSNLLTIWLSALLATQLQEDNGNNVFLGVIIIIIAIALFVVFWQWWRTVEEEDTAVDLRTTNAHSESAMETAVASDAHHTHDEDHGPAIEHDEHAAAEQIETETAVAPEPETAPEPMPEPEPEPEPVASEVPVTPDDLTKIEGIGPKISQLLQAAGIATFAQLTKAEIGQIEQILEAAGSRYRLADPSTWPQQAGLAAAEKWEDLEALQENLKGGRTAE